MVYRRTLHGRRHGVPVCLQPPGPGGRLILLGAYLYGDYPPEDTLTIYGSLNQSVEDKIDWVRIPEAYHLITTDKKYDCVMPFGQQAFIDKMVEYCPESRKSHHGVF